MSNGDDTQPLRLNFKHDEGIIEFYTEVSRVPEACLGNYSVFPISQAIVGVRGTRRVVYAFLKVA